ncbi:MAG: spore coat protein CotH, partial [Verrucomicrobiales bacterium]|nr:spore coat protein CotH [Verrucomicrobiales bacterium]
MQSLYPGLDVLGPFTNKLSKSSSHLALKDPQNNLADEVRYFAGGHWPEYADGGGSSLELREPRSDNSRAESWAASNESGRSQWQTFTWRGVSAPGQSGEPSLWHELNLCLLDGAGEVLLDDISVIETPATAPKQLIPNGTFNDGTSAHWRFLGNHRGTRVEPEASNPGNNVLHLVATGPGEYQGNQIETTLTNNVAIVDGREYEISFRAKWLSGKRKLNARLYFNRLARTFDLPVPLRSGTPGTVNSRYISNVGPTYSNLGHSPAIPLPNQPVVVTVNASDSDGIQSATLKYSVSGASWQSVPMVLRGTNAAGFAFSGTIPGQPTATVVQFYVEGGDGLGASSFYPAGGTNSRAVFVVQDNQAFGSAAHNFRVVMTPADAAFLHTATNTLSNELLGCTVIYDETEVFYDCGVRLKGSFVGRNVARVGFHVVFDPEHPFRGIHEVVSVDRSQHTAIGSVGEIVTKHIANHAGGIPDMQDDLARFIAPLSSYTSMSQLRFSGFDSDFLDAQFNNGSDGSMYEMEVIRWNLSTVDGNPESVKLPGNESGGTGYVNLEVQNYGDSKESYRWVFLQANQRTADNYDAAIGLGKTFSLTGAALDAQAPQVLDVEEWLRVMAYQELVGPADSYYTGANIHNFRVYQRPADLKVLYLPWDWDSSYLAATTAPIFGTGNIANLLANANNRRSYLNHMFDIISTTFNSSYMARWTTHYGAVSGQDMSGILNYISARAGYALGQLPTAAAFAITSNNGNDFGTSNSSIAISGTAPIGIRTIEVNGTSYPMNWNNLTNWTINIPLFSGTNLLQVQGVDNAGNRPANALDTITITNAGPGAFLPVVINEWMADNAGPAGLADPADGLFQDWFELFNPNTNGVNLSGYYLTDNLSIPAKWRIPTNTTINPRGFLLVWADNQTNQNLFLPNTDLHAAFQLGAGGEAIGLYGPDGLTPQSTVIFGPQMQNVSQGLFPDGNTNAVYAMTNFTPRLANTLAGPLRWVQMEYAGFNLTLTWSAVAGRHYRVEYKDDLAAPLWTEFPGTIQAIGATASISDAMSSHRFYQVIRVD